MTETGKDKAVTRQDIEKALWMMSSWKVEQSDVDVILEKVDGYAASLIGATVEAVVAGQDLPTTEESTPIPLPPSSPDEPQASVEEIPEPPAEPLEESQAGIAIIEDINGRQWRVGGVPVPYRPARPPAPPRVFTVVETRDDGSRKCRVCVKFKPEDQFGRDTRSPGGIRTACKECSNAAKRDRVARKRAGMG